MFLCSCSKLFVNLKPLLSSKSHPNCCHINPLLSEDPCYLLWIFLALHFDTTLFLFSSVRCSRFDFESSRRLLCVVIMHHHHIPIPSRRLQHALDNLIDCPI